jgi:CheY-like chemotaxis protein
MNNNKQILVVDDVEGIRQELSLLLEEEGHQVFQAGNGKEALDILKDNQCDLMVTDILMPDMDGVELVQATEKAVPNMSVLVISGGSKSHGNRSGFDYLKIMQDLTHVDRVLKKPFTDDELLTLVRSLLD